MTTNEILVSSIPFILQLLAIIKYFSHLNTRLEIHEVRIAANDERDVSAEKKISKQLENLLKEQKNIDERISNIAQGLVKVETKVDQILK